MHSVCCDLRIMSPLLDWGRKSQKVDHLSLSQEVPVHISLPFVLPQAIDQCDSNPLLTSIVMDTAL